MRRPSRYSPTKQGIVRSNKWLGVNTTDANTALAPGYVPYAKNVDFSREPGAAAKRLGCEALFASLGAGGCTGVFTYHHSAGDRILVGKGTALYKLEGASNTYLSNMTYSADLSTTGQAISGGDYDLSLVKENAFDDDPETVWASTQSGVSVSGAAYIGQNFGTAKVIRKIMVQQLASYAITSVKLQSSSDGLSWGNVQTLTLATDESEQYFDISYSAGKAYWRLLANANPSATWALKEVEMLSGNIDWDAGTKTDVQSTADGTVILNPDGSTFNVDQSDTTASNTFTLSTTNKVGQKFQTGATTNYIGKVDLYAGTPITWDAGENVTLKLYAWDTDYATTVAGAVLGTVTVNGPQAVGYVAFAFSSPIAVSPSTDYFIETSVNTGSLYLYGDAGGGYASGAAYASGVAQVTDLTFKVYSCPYEASGTWESPSYDLTNTPVAASIAWNVTTPANTTLTFQVKGSQDNVNWGSWQTIAASTDGIPLARYLKVKATLATSDGVSTPTLSDFTITYETSFTTATSIKSGLTGNKIRFAEQNEICYFADGGKPHKYDGTTVSDIDTTTTVLTQVSIVCTHKNYLFYVDDSDNTKLYFPDVGSETSIAANNYKQMPNSIKALKSAYNDALIVSGKGFTDAIYGTVFDDDASTDDTNVVYLGTTEAVSHESIVECVDAENRNTLVVPTATGVKYLVPGLQTQSLQVLPLSDKVQKYFDQAIERHNQAAIFNKQKLLISICHNESGDAVVYTNNTVFLYDFRTSQWSGPFKGWNIAGFCAASGTDANGYTQADEIFAASSTIGRLYQLFKGTSDAGSNITFKLDTPYYGEAWNKREYRRARLTVASSSTTTTLQLSFKVDNNTPATVTPGAIATWNVGVVGTDPARQDALVSPNQPIYQPQGSYFGVEITDDSTNDFIIYGIEADFEERQGVI